MFVTVVNGGFEPTACQSSIAADACPVEIETGEVVLRHCVFLLSCLREPFGGLGIVGLCSMTVVVHHAEIGLRFAVPQICGLLIERQRFGMVGSAVQTVMGGKSQLIELLRLLALQRVFFGLRVVLLIVQGNVRE